MITAAARGRKKFLSELQQAQVQQQDRLTAVGQATKDNSSSSTSSTKENANPTKADTSVADVKRSEEVVSAVKENVKVADKKATVDKKLIDKVKGEKGAAVVLPIASATGESVSNTNSTKYRSYCLRSRLLRLQSAIQPLRPFHL